MKLDLMPVFHPGGTKEMNRHPPQVDLSKKEFLAPKTKAYLINAENNRKNYNPEEHTAEDRWVISDSGGLQTATQGVTMDAEKVMKWQNEHCDVAISLDDLSPFRPAGFSGVMELGNIWANMLACGDKGDFLKSAHQSRKYLDTMLKHRSDDTKVYCIIQGYSAEQCEAWYNIVAKNVEGVDGYCLKTNFTIRSAFDVLGWGWNNLDKPIHFLGCGAVTKTYPLVLFSEKYKHKTSADSTSYSQGTMTRTMFFGGYKISMLSENGLKEYPCGCTVCDWGNQAIIDGKVNVEHYTFPHVMSAHNWWQMLNEHETLSRMAKNQDFYISQIDNIIRPFRAEGDYIREEVKASDVCSALADVMQGGDPKVHARRLFREHELAEAYF